MLFPPLVGVCSGVHFHFECTFMTLTPFPLAGFFKISLAVCYFSNGFGPWPSHYLQGVYKRTNYRLTCTSFKGKQILKHVFFSRPYITKFYTQKYSRLRCLLHIKGLVICFYLGWSGSILHYKWVQYIIPNIYIFQCNIVEISWEMSTILHWFLPILFCRGKSKSCRNSIIFDIINVVFSDTEECMFLFLKSQQAHNLMSMDSKQAWNAIR